MLSARARRVDPLVAAAVVAGVAIRIWTLASENLSALDSDEAVWGLMARHVLDGEFEVFFWNQNYGGTQEVLLTAPLVGLFDGSSLALRLVPTVLFGLACVLTWQVGRRLVGERTARISAVVLWVSPAYVVWKSTRAHGFYGAGLVLGLAVVLFALRLRERPSTRDAAGLGLATGLGCWATPQIAILVVPALAWLVWRRPGAIRHASVAVAAIVLGALPWIVWNVRHDLGSFRFPGNSAAGLDQLRRLFASTLPTELGLRVPFTLDWLVTPVLGWAALAAAIGGFLWLLVRHQHRRRLELVLLTCVLFTPLYAVSPFAWSIEEPRYLFMLAPVLSLLLAYGLRRWALLVCLALAVAGLAKMDDPGVAAPIAEDVHVPNRFGPLLDLLEQHGVNRVYANYWVAYPIAFGTQERILAAPSNQRQYRREAGRVVPVDDGYGRYRPHTEAVRSSRDVAHVFVAGGAAERRSRTVLTDGGYLRVRAGGFVVYLPPR